MVSLATVVFPEASNRWIGWPTRLPAAAGVVGLGGWVGGVGSERMRPESGRGMIVPGFGFGCGCWSVWARAVPLMAAGRAIARNRVIKGGYLRLDLRGRGKGTRHNTTGAQIM